MPILLAGSRSLPHSIIVSQVVRAVLASGELVHVGCSAGADHQVLSAVIRSASFSQCRAFAAFAQSGAGSIAVSAVATIQAFASLGGSVSWLAGGPLSLPVQARLIRRSAAALATCSAAVFFQPGPGSLAVASIAASRGVPVFAFAPAAPAAPRGQAGAWHRSSFLGFPCWAWRSAQASMF